MTDIEFIQNEENTKEPPKTQKRAQHNSKAGGKHDPTKPSQQPTPAPKAPAKPTPEAKPQQQQAKPAPNPTPTPTPTPRPDSFAFAPSVADPALRVLPESFAVSVALTDAYAVVHAQDTQSFCGTQCRPQSASIALAFACGYA